MNVYFRRPDGALAQYAVDTVIGVIESEQIEHEGPVLAVIPKKPEEE